MKRIFLIIGNGLLFGLGFLIILIGGYSVMSWTTSSNTGADGNLTAETDDTLTLSKWNGLVQKVSTITTDFSGNVTVDGDVNADAFVGDGSGLTNLPIGSETDPNVNSLGKATLDCSTNQVVKYDGTAWVCGDDNDTSTSETDPNVNSLGKATLNCSTNQVVKYNGTAWVCGDDNDTSTSETDPNVNSLGKATLNCSTNQVVKFNGTAWVCGDDNDTSTSETDPNVNSLGKATLNCSTNQVVKFNGTAWVCGDDNDTSTSETDPNVNSLGKATLNCSTNQVVKFNGNTWVCGDDNDTSTSETDPNVNSLGKATLNCSTNQVVKFNGTAWVCGNDNDASETDPNVNSLGKSTLNCSTNQIAKYNGSAWVCASDNVGVSITIPAGAIWAFNLSSCPSGWKPTDGTNGTPDLRNRFIRGLGTGRTLGSFQANDNKSHLHSVNPPSTTSTSNGNHRHGVTVTTYDESLRGTIANGSSGHAKNVSFNTNYAGTHAHTVDIAAFNSDSSGATEARPDNVALLYCQKE